ncbi:Mn2+ homeostasis protein [Pseudohyphozyma bogoriensis]|nr:Mn2+ homeostasis protein [Pseudohyphozyma bogoriensis]
MRIARTTAALVGLSSVPLATASLGDRSPAYQSCIATCTSSCPSTPASPLQLWPCPAECSYTCLTQLTELALAASPADTHLTERGAPLDGLPLAHQVQYHGKWPFVRYFYMQELLSVIFSFGNLYFHARGLRHLQSIPTRSSHSSLLKRDYMRNAYVGINTWIWSAVFHTRDVSWTEKADYFSAAASTLYGLWLVLDRMLGMYAVRGKRWRKLTQVVFVGVFAAHCGYLVSRERFDYGYNMLFNVVVGVSQILLWSAWSLSHLTIPASQRPPHYLSPLPIAFCLLAFTSLELLDFEPVPSDWRLLDAHALWHFSTIGVVKLWYDSFLKRDLRWMDGEDAPLGRDRGKRDV